MKFVMEIEAEEESMAEICRAYGVSRKTGYKWLERHQAEGVAGLADRSRAPHSHPNAVSAADEEAILKLRSQHSNWGERKLRKYLNVNWPEQAWPSASAIGDILKRHRRRRRAILKRHGLTHAHRVRRSAARRRQISSGPSTSRDISVPATASAVTR